MVTGNSPSKWEMTIKDRNIARNNVPYSSGDKSPTKMVTHGVKQC